MRKSYDYDHRKDAPHFILKFSVEPAKVQEKYEIFIGNNPSGKISYGDAMAKIEEYVKVRWPNADSMSVTYALYPAFDPENT